MMRYTKEGVGESIVNIVGSISNLTTQRYNDKTMLANYGHIPCNLTTPQEIYDAAQEVKKQIADVSGREGMYMNGMLDAFSMFARVLEGDAIPYKDAIAVMQQVSLHPVPEEKFQALSNAISENLGKLGYTGNVGQQVTAYLKDTAIAPDQVAPTAYRYIGKAKDASLRRVLTLPEEDGIDEVKAVRNVFWSGYSRYIGGYRGDLSFNVDRPWSLPTFVNILCHEGYPGHQAFYCHWDHLYQQGKLPLEGAFYSTAGNPADPMFEGSPEVGLHFLGWDDFSENTPEITDEEKQAFIIGRDILDLQRMLQTQGCYMYHVDGADHDEVIRYMLSNGIYNEIEVENTFKFFTHPVQRYYYPAYYYGRWMIFEAYEKIPKADREAFFRLLYDRPHTNETFIKEVSQMIGRDFDPFATC